VSLLIADTLEKRFTKRPDLIGRLVHRAGLGPGETTVHAVDGVSLAVEKGEVLGLVGESGCGKSTVGRMLAGVLPPSAGRVLFDGIDLTRRDTREKRLASLGIQMIFQDPFASMNPRYRVRDIIAEAPIYHGIVSRREAPAMVADMLQACGLDSSYADRLPHQFSGGQRQRISIARALAMQPQLVICDEAVAALDVSIQAQVLNLFFDLRERFNLTYVFISHDLSVVRHISDRVAIMYLGRIVEIAETDAIFSMPRHPYTRALIQQSPSIKRRKHVHKPIEGEVPSPLAPPPGCHFHLRCPLAFDRCRVEAPALTRIDGGRHVACHLGNAPLSEFPVTSEKHAA
jgi:peptide/nickel transport system ATP-binding protein